MFNVVLFLFAVTVLFLIRVCPSCGEDTLNPPGSLKLRLKWSNRPLHNPLAKEIEAQQRTCTKNLYFHKQRNHGMGSDIHIWTQALCNAMQQNATLIQIDEPWIWNDAKFCYFSKEISVLPFGCYFNVNLRCNWSGVSPPAIMSWSNALSSCPRYITDAASRKAFRTAAVDYMFSNLSPKLVSLAKKKIRGIFGTAGIPTDLITVHIRWGDKQTEMDLVHESEYYSAIAALVSKYSIAKPHIYVTTESLSAVTKLSQEIANRNASWALHYYAPAVFQATSNNKGTQLTTMEMAKHSQGSLGLASLIALLIAMEAKYFVLTSGSNWSRLIDELRVSVADPACGGCTKMVDLREGIASAQNW